MRPVAWHPWLNYGRVFAPWRAAFGERVAVTPFERSRLPLGLPGHFLGLLGAGDLAARAVDVPTNVRTAAKEFEVRRLTALALRRGRNDPCRVVGVLRGLSALLVPDAPFAGLSGDRARGLMDRFAAVNAAFARDYGIGAHDALFRDPPVDGLARPNTARWSELSAVERDAVREYVMRTVGVDPTPQTGGAGHRPRRPRSNDKRTLVTHTPDDGRSSQARCRPSPPTRKRQRPIHQHAGRPARPVCTTQVEMRHHDAEWSRSGHRAGLFITETAPSSAV